MSSGLRIPLISLLVLALQLVMATVVSADGGVHIVVVKPLSRDTWFIREFVDNSLVATASVPLDADALELKPGIFRDDGAGSPITILSIQSQPLITFSSENADSIEERLAQVSRDDLTAGIEWEIDEQIIEGLFHIPLWPYLAASEIPMKRLDFERSSRIPDYRAGFFTVDLFAGRGDVRAWDVGAGTPGGTVVMESALPGEGGGLVIEYMLVGDLDGVRFRIPQGAHVSALYVEDTSNWQINELEHAEMPAAELIRILDESSAEVEAGIRYSSDRIVDSVGAVGRYLVAPFGYDGSADLMLCGSRGEGFSTDARAGTRLNARFLVFLLWIAFSLFVFMGNRLYSYSSDGPILLLMKAIAIYPLFLLVSLLTSGFWGLGFIPAAVAASRFLAPEGKRAAAIGVVLFASFAVMFTSWIIIR